MGKTRLAIPGFKGKDLKTGKRKHKSLRKLKNTDFKRYLLNDTSPIMAK